MLDSTGKQIDVKPIDPIIGPIAGEKNISDWQKIWEEFKTSTIGKIMVQEIIKMAIEKALKWAIKELPKMIENGTAEN